MIKFLLVFWLLLWGVWTAPRTWVVGEVPTAALMNLHVRDNLLFLGATHDHSGDAGDGQTLGVGHVLAVQVFTR